MISSTTKARVVLFIAALSVLAVEPWLGLVAAAVALSAIWDEY